MMVPRNTCQLGDITFGLGYSTGPEPSTVALVVNVDTPPQPPAGEPWVEEVSLHVFNPTGTGTTFESFERDVVMPAEGDPGGTAGTASAPARTRPVQRSK